MHASSNERRRISPFKVIVYVGSILLMLFVLYQVYSLVRYYLADLVGGAIDAVYWLGHVGPAVAPWNGSLLHSVGAGFGLLAMAALAMAFVVTVFPRRR